MSLWFEMGLTGLLWAGLIAGLVYVVRDCVEERYVEPTLPGLDDEECPICCSLSGVESLPRSRDAST